MPLTREQRLAFLEKARATRSNMQAAGIKQKKRVKYGGMMKIDPSILDSMLIAREQMIGNCRLVGSDSMVANLPLNTERGQEHFTKIPVPAVGAELQPPVIMPPNPQTSNIGENPGFYKIPPRAEERKMSGYGGYPERNVMGPPGPGYARFVPMTVPAALNAHNTVVQTKMGNGRKVGRGVRDGEMYCRSDQYAGDFIVPTPTNGIRASPGLSKGGQLDMLLDNVINPR